MTHSLRIAAPAAVGFVACVLLAQMVGKLLITLAVVVLVVAVRTGRKVATA